jgi:hypothetical protein
MTTSTVDPDIRQFSIEKLTGGYLKQFSREQKSFALKGLRNKRKHGRHNIEEQCN